jgi:soluble epoxide hydrolase/lipid-phosphate phosphatase
LTVWGTKDATVAPALINSARNSITNLQVIVLEDKGHWILVEAKDEVTEKVLSWLHGLGITPKSTCPARL